MVTIKIIFGTDWCGDCKRTKKFLEEYKILYEWKDIDIDDQAREEAIKLNKGKPKVPTIVFSDDTILIEPKNNQIAEKLGIEYKEMI